MARGRWRRWVALSVLLTAVLSAGLAMSGAWLARVVWEDAKLRQQVLDRLLDGTGVSVELGSVEVVQADHWELLLDGVHVTTPTADVRVAHAQSGVPGFWSVVMLGRFDLGEVRIDGLSVTVPKRPLPVSTSGRSIPLRVVMDHLTVRDGALHMPESEGLPEVRADGVEARLRSFAVVGGKGIVRGTGRMEMRRWRTGRITVDDVVVEDVRLSRNTHHLGGGRLTFAGGGAEGTVVIDNVRGKRPAVTADIRIRDGDFGKLVAVATGKTSPMSGRLSGSFHVEAGGKREPGAGLTVAELQLDDGALLLGDTTSAVLKAALKVAPFLKVRRNQVLLGPTEVSLRMSGGRVDIDRLVHRGGGRPLAARGAVVGKNLDLVVRLLPKKKADKRKGMGLVVQGSAGAMTVRRAAAEELTGLGEDP